MDAQLETHEQWDPRLVVPSEFQILEQLGQGGFGCVYKALHKNLGSNVAIKFIRKDSFAGEEDLLTFFHKEARAIARLDHPNIVKALHVGLCKDQTPILVFEYLDGETLESYFKRSRVLSPRLISSIFSQLLRAIEHAHSHGVIHRDIKPANIMLIPEQTSSALFHVKLLDFGTAKTRRDSGTGSTTNTTSLVGSPYYMSPEQCRGERADGGSDIYSLGCVLYECLLGQPPFAGDTPIHTLYKQINEPVPLPDKRLSAGMNKLLQNCLAKDASLRGVAGRELECQLKAALNQMQTGLMPIKGNKAIILSLSIAMILISACLLGKPLAEKCFNKTLALSDLELKGHTHSRYPKLRLKKIDLALHRTNGLLTEKEAAAYLSELTDCIPQFKGNKDMLFVCYTFKAILEKWLRKYNEEEASLQQALECCKVTGGFFPREACQTFTQLAENAKSRNNFELAEKYARQALLLLKEVETSECPDMSIGDYDCIDITVAAQMDYDSLSRAAAARGDLKTAEKDAKLAIQAAARSHDPVADFIERLSLVELYEKMGKKALARQEIDALRKMTDSSLEKPERVNEAGGANLIKASYQVARWYERNGEPELALRSLKDCQKFNLALKHKVPAYLESIASELNKLKTAKK